MGGLRQVHCQGLHSRRQQGCSPRGGEPQLANRRPAGGGLKGRSAQRGTRKEVTAGRFCEGRAHEGGVTKETKEKAAKEDDATEELAMEEAPKEERAKEEESKDDAEEKLPRLEDKTAPNSNR